MSLPLVSCIMPTKGCREFIRQAMDYFLRQSYPNKELVIVYDEPVIEFATDAVRHLRGPAGVTLGAKRNWCVEHSRGDLIAHWDDDDWYGPTRLADQVSFMQSGGLQCCGLDTVPFWDLRSGLAYSYHFADHCPYGATLMYYRKFWERHPFEDTQIGETDGFLRDRVPREVLCIRNTAWYVGMIHDGNTCPKAIGTKYYTEMTWRELPALLSRSADWPFYQGLRERMGAVA